MSETQPPEKTPWELGIVGLIGVMVGVGAMGASAISMLGILVGIELELSSGGAGAELPTEWSDAFILLGLGGAIALVTMVLSRFIHVVRTRSGWLSRIALLVVALVVLGVSGRFIQLKVLEQTYGSMAAWYAANNDIDALRAELEAGVSEEVLEDAMSRAFQWEHGAIVALLLDHGAAPGGLFGGCLLAEAPGDIQAIAADRGWNADCSRK